MKRDYRVYLDDILESITLIESYTDKISQDKFLNSIETQDAVIRRLEIIGIAVKHIPEEIKNKSPKVPWNNIVGARNIFAHEYFGVQLDRVWDSIVNDLPSLKEQIRELLKESDQ